MNRTKAKPLPLQEDLNRLLRYEPDTGKLFWKVRTSDMFVDRAHTAVHTCNRWNSKFAGKEAFTSANSTGYLHGTVMERSVLAHRVIWKMVTGEDADDIDHEDGSTANNRWSNLFDKSRQGNLRNMARSFDNTSGVTGVRWTIRGMWQAFIGVNYKTICLGSYHSFDEAVAARKAAEVEHGFHPNHGREAVEQNAGSDPSPLPPLPY